MIWMQPARLSRLGCCEWVKWMSEEWNHPNNRIHYHAASVLLSIAWRDCSTAVHQSTLCQPSERGRPPIYNHSSNRLNIFTTNICFCIAYISGYNIYASILYITTMCIVLCSVLSYHILLLFYVPSYKMYMLRLRYRIMLCAKCSGW